MDQFSHTQRGRPNHVPVRLLPKRGPVIDFVSWLVMIQSGKAKFAIGLPTVGGRTHIGVITKNEFKLLGELDLEHRFTGFEHDL